MNGTLPAAIGGTIRHFLTGIGGLLAGAGVFTEDEIPTFVGAVSFLIGVLWSWNQKRAASRKLTDAIAAPAGYAKPVVDPDPGYRSSRLQAPPLAVLAALGLALLLSACGNSGVAPPIIGLDTPVADSAPAPAKDSSAEAAPPTIETVGDMLGICVSRGTAQPIRSACVAMGFSGVIDLMTDRVTKFDPQDAAVSLGRIAMLQAVQQRFDEAGGIFFNTEIRLATLTVTEMLADVARDRIGRDVGLFAGGINVPGILKRGEVLARQGAIAAAVAADVKAALTEMLAGTLDPLEVRAVALARIEQNEARIAGVAGAIP